MMQLICRRSGWLVVLALVAAVGCGEGSDVGTVAVTGTVTQKGSPIEGAVVTFVPVGTEGQSAVGVTDATGTYKLTTVVKDDGAIPGEYKVSVTKYEGPAPTTGGGEAAGPNGEMPDSYSGEAPEAPPAQNLLPAKYSDPASSGLTATVSDGGAPQNFDLEG